MRPVSLCFSATVNVFVSEDCGHQIHPVRAMPLPALPLVTCAEYENALTL